MGELAMGLLTRGSRHAAGLGAQPTQKKVKERTP
jgi:hypothetical protein